VRDGNSHIDLDMMEGVGEIENLKYRDNPCLGHVVDEPTFYTCHLCMGKF
jgi:hypothetical protein